MRILVADDNKSMLKIIEAILRRWNYEVFTAADGVEALDCLLEHNIQFVISDWMMPRMDGPELCRRVRGAGFESYVYLILLTGRDDRQSLIQGMEAGADDFLVKPVDPEELRVRIRAGMRILDLEQQLAERNRHLVEAHASLSEAYGTIRKDLESAAAMQKALLPQPSTFGEIRLDWLFYPSQLVAGDMFGYFMLDEHNLGFYMLDVAGHGTPAALLSFTLNTVLLQGRRKGDLLKEASERRPFYRIASSARVVEELNRRFEADVDSMLYFTMIYAVVDLRSGRLDFTQAGHPPPIHVRHHDGSAVPVGRGGFPVGMLPEAEWEVTSIDWAPGDRIILYSDGFTECENLAGEPFSQARLLELLCETAGQPLAEVIRTLDEALRTWKPDGRYQDDVSVLALERAGR